MPTSVKVKLRRQPNRSGEKGIVIQVIHNRKSTELSINEYVKENLFDHVNSEVRAKHPRSAKINKTISDELKKVKDIVFEFQVLQKFNVVNLRRNSLLPLLPLLPLSY